MEEQRGEAQLFVVRIWYESSTNASVMRGQVDDPVSGRRRYFSNLGELCDFITNAKRPQR